MKPSNQDATGPWPTRLAAVLSGFALAWTNLTLGLALTQTGKTVLDAAGTRSATDLCLIVVATTAITTAAGNAACCRRINTDRPQRRQIRRQAAFAACVTAMALAMVGLNSAGTAGPEAIQQVWTLHGRIPTGAALAVTTGIALWALAANQWVAALAGAPEPPKLNETSGAC